MRKGQWGGMASVETNRLKPSRVTRCPRMTSAVPETQMRNAVCRTNALLQLLEVMIVNER